MCLDAADPASFSGTQQWTDLSAAGNHMVRGGTSSSESQNDPALFGSIGSRSKETYWLFTDNLDRFTVNNSTNPAWVSNMTKNNAKTAFSFWIYLPDLVGLTEFDIGQICGAVSPTVDGRTAWFLYIATESGGHAPGRIGFIIYRDEGDNVVLNRASWDGTNFSSDMVITPLKWQYCVIRYDEAAASVDFQINEKRLLRLSSSNPDPSTTTIAEDFRIGTLNSNLSWNAPLKAGTRLACFNVWDGTLPSAAKLDQYFRLTRGRFGV